MKSELSISIDDYKNDLKHIIFPNLEVARKENRRDKMIELLCSKCERFIECSVFSLITHRLTVYLGGTKGAQTEARCHKFVEAKWKME